ncbi:MAG TPA: flagellar biosynthesis protein FlhB [Bacteroidetes bacterium]|nr:flagellar biosynthesis protein FlhB [Bacteroidota bacterium]
MAENESGQEKTEAASPRRRQDARQKGNVAKSQEVNSAAIILFGTGFLYLASGYLLQHIIGVFKKYLKNAATYDLSRDQMLPLYIRVAVDILVIMAPFLVAVLIVGLISNIAQVGFMFSVESMKPKFEKLDLIKGVKRLFALKSLVELLKNMLKLGIIGIVVYTSLSGLLPRFFTMMDQPIGGIITFLASTSGMVLLKTGVAMFVLAVADYAYQRYEFEKNLKMSKQEVKEEHKSVEGNPLIKSRIREIQFAAMRKRMMAAVPEADVVITNPIHYAVALKYSPEDSAAPVVLAKGERLLAQRIKDIAREHDIPIVENPPLARLLFRESDVGQEIPLAAYQAVAEVLGYIYRLRNKQA